jgi:hypothetical protein
VLSFAQLLRMESDDESYVDDDLDVVPQPKKRKMQQKQTRRLKVSIVHDSDEEHDEDYQNSDQEDVEEKLVPTEDENEELEPEPTLNALTLLRYQPPAQSNHARARHVKGIVFCHLLHLNYGSQWSNLLQMFAIT